MTGGDSPQSPTEARILPWRPRKAPGRGGASEAEAPSYAELQVTTGFSFLYGASHAQELLETAVALGLSAIGIADRNTVAGVVRAHEAAKEAGLRLLVGSRLCFRDGTPDMLCYPQDRAAWGRLTRLLTTGNLRGKKGECLLDYADLHAHGEGQILLVVPPDRLSAAFCKNVQWIATDLPGGLYLAASRRYRSDDARRLQLLANLGDAARAPMVATNDVLYHAPERRALQDVLTCIREGCTIAEAGFLLQPNAERHLKSPTEIARLFRNFSDAVARTAEIVQGCRFSLDELAYEYPDEPVTARADSRRASGSSGVGRGRQAVSAGHAGKGAGDPGEGAARDRPIGLRALFPNSARHRALCAQREHIVPGSRLGSQFCPVLLPRYYSGQSYRD